MLEVLKDDKAGERSWVAASKTLVSMTTAELASIDCVLRVEQQTELRDEIDAIKVAIAGKQGGAKG